MKKRLVALVAAGILLLTACAKIENITFTATIENVSDNNILVATTEDVGFDKASVRLTDVKIDFNLTKGQTVELTILPEIAESYPVQVTAVDIKQVK
ncbi:hypothetical protein EDD70_2654 [Hydrogenoanaerobacterium saccharovorans]|uniref:DUF3221 domain-containing protein n=1 Tax=Hydrogenoanaerobacterium saccharovorans TaxID=474960 RepID=A0A1H8DNX1_9FIRM|nr:hypothetical protein [Hydrogenoanaerobacterium saccharovorans]RPF42311.1 hypothetical protein EDD70_2654 [Hydrogenoanaerobacterium saccharovorans]SEN08913.1 hypothetical protein SAMN05216180_2715 [Hydrogenoanaerobacterium saccharovorans]